MDNKSIERLTASVRGKVMVKFPEYFLATRTSIERKNDADELIYQPDFVETGIILTFLFKHEGMLMYTMLVIFSTLVD